MSNLRERITMNPEQCGGRPCIRGMRIRVTDVLELFAAAACLPNKYCKNSPTWNRKIFRLASPLPHVSWTIPSSFHETVGGRSTLAGDGVLDRKAIRY